MIKWLKINPKVTFINNPEDANEHCPGVKSDEAGKSEACAGCPNQTTCASGEARKEDPSNNQIVIF